MNREPIYFVPEGSIVRRIWGDSDTVLFIFAGAAAEFALNKAVDWLYFTGRLPADPLGRLFSTVAYAHRIIFSPAAEAHRALDSITAIHSAVEGARQATIPDWAYRDVLYMLIHYTCASFELLYRPLTAAEQEDIFHVFLNMGSRMGLKDLPDNYNAWIPDRADHLKADLAFSNFTKDLFKQYKKHLGRLRYALMLGVQSLLLPHHARKLLGMGKGKYFKPVIQLYRLARWARVHEPLRGLLLPGQYRKEIEAMNRS